MKQFFIYIIVMIIGTTVWAQQKPQYTQYILNQYILNPALTGIENYVDVKASHRLQWAGLLDAPVTTYLTVQGAIGKEDYKSTATSMHIPGDNPRGKNYWEEYTASKPHHGWGMQIINDRTGPLNNFSAFGTYAYHIGLSPRTNLAAGIGLGITNTSLDASKLQFYNPIDPAVANSGLFNTIKFDMNAGVYLYSADFFIGLSALQIMPSKIEFASNTVRKTDGKAVPHIFLTAGKRYLVGDNFNFIPSVLIKFVQPAPVQIEVNGKLQYQDFLWVGASYRHNDGIAAMVGFNVSSTFNFGYAYDYTTSNLNNYTKGTHEIVIGFLIGNQYGDTCPKNVW